MIIYVEYVLIDNLVINFLILALTKKILKANSTKTKMLLGSLVGTVFALISPIFSNVINILIKLPLAVVMILICFKPKTKKHFFTTLLTFVLCTFAFGGSVFAFAQIFGIKLLTNNGIMYEYKFPVGFALLVCCLTFVIAKNIAIYLLSKTLDNKYEFDVTLKNDSKLINAQAFLDTGNKLTIDGKPISIINYKTFNKLFPTIELSNILLRKELPLNNSKYIEVESIGSNKQKILVFEIDKMTINLEKTTGKNIKTESLQYIEICPALLGLSLVDFSKKTNSDIIISNQILGENYEIKQT